MITRLGLTSFGIWALSIITHYVYATFWEKRTNMVEGYPLVVNPGSIGLAIGLAFVLLVAHYLSAVGRATSSDFSWAALAMVVTTFPMSIIYWIDGGWIIQAFVFALIILALEFHWPNWIWELRRRLKRESV